MNIASPDFEILFVDCDAFFASCEQVDRPELRGKPIAVTPVMIGSGCCIATSYPARAVGVKTGTRVSEARRLCPEITVVQARPDRYIEIHHELVAAVEAAVPVSEIESVDELWCRLLANERGVGEVTRIAGAIKAEIRDRVGPLSVSIGVAPNRLLAKVAGAMQKPDGFTMLARSELPGPLLTLGLTDLPGISDGINRRLRAAGIHTMADLYARSQPQLRDAWGSVLGIYWWHWIRGEILPGPKTHRRTVGHQHVLAPEFRAPDQARGVSIRLLSKACQRMRSLGYVATRLSLAISPVGATGWYDWTPVARTDDTVELNEHLRLLWRDAPGGNVLQVGVRLEGLEPADAQIPLFPQERSRRALMQAMDRINRRGGADCIYIGAMHGQRRTAPRRIPFGKPPSLDLPDQDGSRW
ncbi:MAG: DUF4113 domain-containing protein [Planctomycetota bacterium]